jgi:hypothetical protein
LWRNQELNIALMGISRNTRKIGVVSKQLKNPPIHNQQPEKSIVSGESRIPSTFHSNANNDHPPSPPVLGLAIVRPILVANIHQPEENSTTQQVEPEKEMKYNFLFILNMFVSIFTWKNSSSFGLVVPNSLEFHRQLFS